MQRTPIATWVFGAGTVATAAYFAFAFSGTSLWLDEAYSVLLAHRSPAEVVSQLLTDNGPPLYYWLLSLWVAVFGDAEREIRALSGVAYLLTGAVLFMGGRRLSPSSRTVGVLAAALFWISPLAVRHASSARMYSLLGLFTAASLVLFLRELEGTSTRRTRWGAAVLHVAGLFLQYWFAFVLLAQAVAYVWVRRRALRVSDLAWFVAPFLPFAAFWGPVLATQLKSGGSAWISPVGAGALATTFLDFYGSWIAGVAFAVFAVAVVFRRKGRGIRFASHEELFGGGAGVALLIICVASVLVPWLISLAKPIYVVGRYTLIALPPFALFVAAALVRAVGPGRAVALVVPLMVLRLLATTGDQRAWQRRDAVESSRASAQRLMQQAAPDAQILYTGLGGVTLGYYLDRSDRRWPQHTFPGELKQHPGWMQAERMIEERGAELEAEAEAVATSVDRAELWHVYVQGDPVAEVMQRSLIKNRGAPARTIPLPGSFHEVASVYPAR